MKKKILSVLLSVFMVLSLLPAQVFGANVITVYVTISNKGNIPVGADANKTLMAEVPIKVEEGSTVDQVLQVLHETYCPGGYVAEGGWVSKLWGQNGVVLSAINGLATSASVTQTYVQADDHLSFALLTDSTDCSDWLASFDGSQKTVEVDKPLSLHLRGHFGFGFEPKVLMDTPLSQVSVGTVSKAMDAGETKVTFSELSTTDANGQVSLTFDKVGKYYISTSGSVLGTGGFSNPTEVKARSIIAPICVVTVMEPGSLPNSESTLGPREDYIDLRAAIVEQQKTEGRGAQAFCQLRTNGDLANVPFFQRDTTQYTASVLNYTQDILFTEDTLRKLMPKEGLFQTTDCKVLLNGQPLLSAHGENGGTSFESYEAFLAKLVQIKIPLQQKKTTIRLSYIDLKSSEDRHYDFIVEKMDFIPPSDPNIDVMDHVKEYHTQKEYKDKDSDFSAFDFMLEGKTAYNRYTSLSNFGEYMTFSFDKAIENNPNHPYGIDFIVYGNNFDASAPEPGSVSVSKDGTNWYTLAGSMQYEQSTQKREATLFENKKVSAIQVAGTTEDGLLSISKLEPVYGYADVHKCSGLLNAVGDYSVTGIPGEIYSTDHKNAIGDGFDLSWAIDENGKPVNLDEISYIRVQNAIDDRRASSVAISPEIGTIACAKAEKDPVGVTQGLKSLVINGKELIQTNQAPATLPEKNLYYEVNLNDSKASMLELSAKGTDSDHIVVNNAIFTGSASTKLLLNSDGSRMARVVVQNGQKEPVIYTIHVIGGGDPAKNAMLSTMTLTPGDVQKSPDVQNSASFEVAQNVSSIKLKLQTLNPDANIQISGGNLSAPITVKSELQTDALALSTGMNTFQVTVTSTDNSVTNQYTLKVAKAENKPVSNVITVSFQLIGDVDHSKSGSHQEQVWIDTTNVEVPIGSTVKYVTDLMLYNRGISFSNPGNYITKIVDPKSGTALEEFTNGPNSGWMYRLNGKIANSAYAERLLGSGDTLIWSYTDDYTKEKNYESYAPWKGTVVQPPETDAQTIKPDLTVKNGTASTTVKESQISDALAAVKKSGANAIAISLEPTEAVKRAEIFLPAASVQSIAGNSNLSLTVNAPQGTLQLPNELLSYLAKQKGGSELQLSMETRSASELHLQGVNLEGAGIVEVKFMSGNTPITQFDGNLLTLRIPVSKDKGFVAGKRYSAITLSGDSSRENTWADIIQQNGNLLAEMKTKHLSTFIVTNHPVNRFTDVDEKAWYYDVVSYVTSKGIMDGVGKDTFAPNVSMTRAMLTTVLYRLEGKPSVKAENPYSDVASDAWYTNAILWATQNKIVSGCGNGLFGTNESITREELATMLRNYAKLKNNSLSKSNDLSGYSDAKDISAWALEAMKWANAEGLLSGRENKVLAPKGTATRAEVSALLMRFTSSMTH